MPVELYIERVVQSSCRASVAMRVAVRVGEAVSRPGSRLESPGRQGSRNCVLTGAGGGSRRSGGMKITGK